MLVGMAKTPRQRLSERLAALGYAVEADAIEVAQGCYRNLTDAECARWDCFAVKDGRTVQVYSFNSVTECARFGFTLRDVSDHAYDGRSLENHFEADANRTIPLRR